MHISPMYKFINIQKQVGYLLGILVECVKRIEKTAYTTKKKTGEKAEAAREEIFMGILYSLSLSEFSFPVLTTTSTAAFFSSHT